MNGPLAEDFRKAMEVEWDMLNVIMKTWEIVERQPWMNVLLKARFCARGDKQMEGIYSFESFSPVFNWQTLIIMLIISLIYDFATLQVDYTAAFTKSDIDKPPNWESMTSK
jgi:hypothetical protein